MSNKNDFPNRFIHTNEDINAYVLNMVKIVKHPDLDKNIATENIKSHLDKQILFSNRSCYDAVKTGDPFWDIIFGLLNENDENLINNIKLDNDTHKKLDEIHFSFMYRFDSRTIKDDMNKLSVECKVENDLNNLSIN